MRKREQSRSRGSTGDAGERKGTSKMATLGSARLVRLSKVPLPHAPLVTTRQGYFEILHDSASAGNFVCNVWHLRYFKVYE